MPLTITVKSSDSVRPVEKWPDGEWRFSLAHHDARRDVCRFGTAGPHEALHHYGHGLDEYLHHAQVIENREQRGNKDDDGQNLEGEDHAKGAAFAPELVAENKSRAFGGIVSAVR